MNEKQTLSHMDNDMDVRRTRGHSSELGYGRYVSRGKLESSPEKLYSEAYFYGWSQGHRVKNGITVERCDPVGSVTPPVLTMGT